MTPRARHLAELALTLAALAVALWCAASAVRPQAGKPGGRDATVEWWVR